VAREESVSARFAIGVGARSGVEAHALAALVARVVEQTRVAPKMCDMFTLKSKEDEPGFHDAASLLEMKLVFLPLEALLARKHEILTRSPLVEAMIGVGSVAEAAALAGAGAGSALVAPRTATERLTCAIARSGPEIASP
jgi:cobalt-precorrin 5A hydrolase